MSGSLAGTVVGERFRLDEEVSRNATTARYRAFDQTRDREVGAVVLLPGASDEAAVQRFLHTARTMKDKLNHKAILKVQEMGQDGDLAWMITDWFKSQPLGPFIEKRSEPLRFDNAGPIVREILEALDHAHSVGIIHGGLGPWGVVLDKKLKPVLMNFGMDQPPESQKLAHQYRAPEQIRPELGSVGPQTDVYATGVLLYHMVAGSPPFDHENLDEIDYEHVHNRPPVLGDRPVKPPEHLEDAVFKALEKLPAERYPSPREMIQALDRLAKGSAPGVVLSEFMKGRAQRTPGVSVAEPIESRKSGNFLQNFVIALVTFTVLGGAAFILREPSPGSAQVPPPTVSAPADPTPEATSEDGSGGFEEGGFGEDEGEGFREEFGEAGDWGEMPDMPAEPDEQADGWDAPTGFDDGDEEEEIEGWETPSEDWDLAEASDRGVLEDVRKTDFARLESVLTTRKAEIQKSTAAERERIAGAVLARAATQLTRGKPKGTQPVIRWAQDTLGGSDVRAWVLLGKARQQSGDAKGAAWALKRAVEVVDLEKLFKPDQTVRAYAAELRVRARKDADLKKAGRYFLRGLQELSRGRIRTGVRWIAMGVRIDGKGRSPFSHDLVRRGFRAIQRKKKLAVFPLLKSALNLDSGNARVHQALGDHYLTLDLDVTKARFHYRRALRMASELEAKK